MKLSRGFGLIILLSILTGCYSTGRQFVRPDFTKIIIHETTMGEVIGSYGQPDSVSLIERNGKKIECVEYAYYTAMGFALGKGPVGRTASFLFNDGVLIGYLYTSNYPGDSTDFELSKANLIKEGESTRQDIEAILGKPTGEAVYPLIDAEEGREIRYFYVGTEGLVATVSKKIIILLNEKNIAENVEQIVIRE